MTTEEKQDKVFQSPPSGPLDDFWLEQGKGLMGGSVSAIQEAASSLIKGLGLLQGIYLGILGFADFVPKNAEMVVKSLFIFPLLLWVAGLFHCIRALMTESFEFNPHSPDDIEKTVRRIADEKQKNVQTAFWCTSAGLAVAMLLILFHMGK